jgi:hypothetical protein
MTPAAATIQHWRENPVAFVYDNFKVEPDAWQKKVLEAFADPTKHRISMQACAGPGKSAVEAWCGWNFLCCYGEVAGALRVLEGRLRMAEAAAHWIGPS